MNNIQTLRESVAKLTEEISKNNIILKLQCDLTDCLEQLLKSPKDGELQQKKTMLERKIRVMLEPK